MRRLEDQVAIVTGGAQGIGGAASRRLAEEGAKVLIADIDASASEANVETIRQAGGVADSLRADLGVHDDIKAMIDRATHLWGRLLLPDGLQWAEHNNLEQPMRSGRRGREGSSLWR